MPYQNQTLCVPRGGADKLKDATVVKTTIWSVPTKHVLVKVDKFGWSVNNITYGTLGEHPHFRYFDFHPAPKTKETSPKTHGVIPVWGFGTVVVSKVPQIKVGERVFGYFPPSKYMLIPVDEADINTFNFYAFRPHLPKDRRPYNQITRSGSDPMYKKDQEEAAMLYRPLFWTSFWCEDWLNSMDYRGVKQVVISSASSKTGFCLALCIKKRVEKTGRDLQIVGLTSPSNKRFVEGLGLYDSVFLYDDLKLLDPTSGPFCYADVAGNDDLNSRIVAHLGDTLTFGIAMGMSHVGDTKSSIKDTASENTKFEMFFMPEWLHEVRKTTPVTDISRRQREGWKWIMEEGANWVTLERIMGTESILSSYKLTLKGSIKPNRGLVYSFWNEPEVKAKL